MRLKPMPKPDREWFNSIKWSKVCTECRHQNGGTCPMEECAATNYDENGMVNMTETIS